jgi:hypothetical protein
MITQHTKKYNGKAYTFTTGIENGKAPIAIIPGQVHGRTGQEYKLVFKSLFIQGDTQDAGNPIYAVTEWEEQHFDNNGNKIASYTKTEQHRTNDAEFPVFIANILPLLQGSIYNGPVRGGVNADSAFLGYNTKPAFGANGAFIPDEITEAPTYDYHPKPTINEDPLSPQ